MISYTLPTSRCAAWMRSSVVSWSTTVTRSVASKSLGDGVPMASLPNRSPVPITSTPQQSNTVTATTATLAAARWRRSQIMSRNTLVVAGVGIDDRLDDAVTNHVLRGQLDELDPGYVVDDGADHPQPRSGIGRQVHLGDVAGDHHLRVEPEAGEEHLHLLG